MSMSMRFAKCALLGLLALAVLAILAGPSFAWGPWGSGNGPVRQVIHGGPILPYHCAPSHESGCGLSNQTAVASKSTSTGCTSCSSSASTQAVSQAVSQGGQTLKTFTAVSGEVIVQLADGSYRYAADLAPPQQAPAVVATSPPNVTQVVTWQTVPSGAQTTYGRLGYATAPARAVPVYQGGLVPTVTNCPDGKCGLQR